MAPSCSGVYNEKKYMNIVKYVRCVENSDAAKREGCVGDGDVDHEGEHTPPQKQKFGEYRHICNQGIGQACGFYWSEIGNLDHTDHCHPWCDVRSNIGSWFS
jgi:hypothetical protein